MKRRQRRPVLDINGEQSESPRRRWQNKYQQIAVDYPEQNGTPHNPLSSLLGQYNSDSDTEDTKQDSTKLNDKVNDFLKEIQLIVPEQPKPNPAGKADEPTIPAQQPLSHQSQPPTCLWQECFDESTGYPYYWHMETNEVTWEMPAEMRLFQESTNPIHVNPAHAGHAQVQWANFPPNTYPEMQTNIPEGMIPKEVVARNRNRQVGMQQGQHQLQNAQEMQKNTGSKDDESDDEKIEMITSFGNDESESDTSDIDSPVKEEPEETLVAKPPPKSQRPSVNQSASKKSEDTNVNAALSIGPSLPPGIVPMIHGPENASIDMRNIIDNIRNKNKKDNEKNSSENSESQCALSSLSSYEDPSSPKGALKSEENDEEDILRRLKNQARLLQSLGGEVPESVESLIKDESTDDIISQIEKETPSDHKQCLNALETDDSKTEKCGVKTQNKLEVNKSDMLEKEIKISLVAGYGDDSDVEEEVSPKKLAVKPLFPISQYEEKVGTNLQPSLPKTGEIASTPNENSIISTDGIVKKVEIRQTEIASIRIFEYKTAEETEKSGEEQEEIKELNQVDAEKSENSEPQEIRVVRMEPEPPKPNKFLENFEMPTKAFQRKKRIAFDVVPNKSKPVDIPNNPLTKPDAASLTFTTTSSDDTERRGFGFQKEPSDIDNHNLLDIAKETLDKTIVQNKKSGINFVKGETTNVKSEQNTKNEDKPESSEKQLKALTEIVMEKLKFLSEGSQIVSAIQVMAIQLQTLIGAWEVGDLKENYLSDWLTGTGRELGRLERAAAPPGWDCQWDRSHKRYYYRNTTTGEAQWTYPESDVVGGTEEMDLCTTPPPPDHEEPPIIEQSQIETRQSKSELVSSVPSKDDKQAATNERKVVEITKGEPRDPEAPPPPQISSPSPPPPPRIFAEDIKKGKKRRGSTNEKNACTKKEKTEKETTPTPDAKLSVDPPLPPSPPKPSQPPLPPHPPLMPNPPNSEPLPPGVDPPEISYPLTATTIEPSVIYTGASQQTNPIYAATMATTVPMVQMEHHAAIMQGQLMHYPTYHQHLQNHAMIAAANSLTGQDAVQFMMTDYSQVYANSQVIAKPPVKSQRESLGSALDSFYNDIACIEKTNTEQEVKESEAPSKEPTPSFTVQVAPEPEQVVVSADAVGKDKKKKKAKVGIGKKQKEMSSMVAKWQKAQQDFGDSD